MRRLDRSGWHGDRLHAPGSAAHRRPTRWQRSECRARRSLLRLTPATGQARPGALGTSDVNVHTDVSSARWTGSFNMSLRCERLRAFCSMAKRRTHRMWRADWIFCSCLAKRKKRTRGRCHVHQKRDELALVSCSLHFTDTFLLAEWSRESAESLAALLPSTEGGSLNSRRKWLWSSFMGHIRSGTWISCGTRGSVARPCPARKKPRYNPCASLESRLLLALLIKTLSIVKREPQVSKPSPGPHDLCSGQKSGDATRTPSILGRQ